MIIKKIEIEGFGKFQSTAIEFGKGLNLIYGNNEDGKTTLMSFIKMMLYSSSAKTEKSADLFKALRKKYRPWNGSKMSGAIEFESNGKTYRIQKEFLKSDVTDKTTVFCITTGEEVKIANKNEAGEHFLGMSLDEFERSVFMGQSGGFTADNASDSLAMRISNLSVSGDENISHEQILKRLSDAAEELVSKSRKKGVLIDSEARLDAVRLEMQQHTMLEDSQKDTEAEIAQLISEINALESDLNTFSDLDKLENAKRDLNAYYTLQNKLNLLKAVKGQLASYDASYDELEKYSLSAKELNDKIENNLALIQEATIRNDKEIPDEEVSQLCELDTKCQDIRKDLELIRGRIASLWADLQSKTKAALNGARLGAASILAVSIILAAISFFALPFGSFVSIALLLLGTGLFAALFLTAAKRVPVKLAVQLSRRDYEGAVRSLLSFEEEFTQKSPSELELILNALLSDTMSELTDRLGKLSVGDIEQLKSKSAKFRAEDIKVITDELALQKEEFIALSCTIKPCISFSAAKILYVELCESLAKHKSINQEIKTISLATGLENTNEEFVAEKIRELGELVQNTPIRPTDTASSIPQIRSALNEKRSRLGLLQSQIKRPERSMSELYKESITLHDKVTEFKQKYDEINIAIQVMNEAILDTNKGLGSALSQKVGGYISKISGGKYNDVLVPRDLSLETRDQNSQSFHEWKYLSTGAIDKIYFALRLAMTDILADSHGALPMFLDDIFASYDDDSIVSALEFLKDYLQNSGSVSQIMFFTCHKNILEMVENVFADSRNISL